MLLPHISISRSVAVLMIGAVCVSASHDPSVFVKTSIREVVTEAAGAEGTYERGVTSPLHRLEESLSADWNPSLFIPMC